MSFIFSTPVLIRHLWQHKTVVFIHWCLICAVLFLIYGRKKFYNHGPGLMKISTLSDVLLLAVLAAVRSFTRQTLSGRPGTSTFTSSASCAPCAAVNCTPETRYQFYKSNLPWYPLFIVLKCDSKLPGDWLLFYLSPMLENNTIVIYLDYTVITKV